MNKWDLLGMCTLGSVKFSRTNTGVPCTFKETNPVTGKITTVKGVVYVFLTLECKTCFGKNIWVPISKPSKGCERP